MLQYLILRLRKSQVVFFNFVSYIIIDSNYNKSFKQREIKIQKYFDLFVIFTDSVKFNLF